MTRKERGRIGRRVVITHCNGQRVEAGEFTDFSEDIFGFYDEKRATTTLRRRCRDDTITILNVEYDEDYYSMPLSEFVKHAVKLSD